jgi:CTP-dependent riboflavin kinase
VEILSDQHLRTTLGLRDGDVLEFILFADQRAGKMP